MTVPVPPADLLHAAAAKLRARARQATGGPWITTWRGQEHHLDGYRDGDLHSVAEWTYAVATWEPQASEQRADCDTADADYIATVHPAVGLALAALLEDAATRLATDTHPGWQAVVAPHELAVARAVLGNEEEQR